MYCNPYCNRADTPWYTMDKGESPDHRKSPKLAQFPDALGRARTYASKLVMSRSAVRVRSSALLFCCNLQDNRSGRESLASAPRPLYTNRVLLRLSSYFLIPRTSAGVVPTFMAVARQGPFISFRPGGR